MFKLESEQALLETFRPKDRRLVQLSPEVNLPVLVRDYLAWTQPSGGRVCLVFSVPGGAPTGIVFDTTGGSGHVPQMCEWCHCTGVGAQVGLLTTALNAKKRVGVHLCVDLSCKRKLEEEADRTGRSSAPEVERVVERMGRFASEVLTIDLSGAGR